MQRRTLLLSGGAALVATGGYAGYTALTGQTPDLGTTLIAPNAAHAQTAEGPVDTSRVTEMALGNPDAAVTITEFASFTCPHCAAFHANVWPQIKAAYVDTGLVRFVYREVYFDAHGLWAALVARCGGEARYFGIVEILYQEQQQWARSGDGNAVADALRRIGRRAGLNDDELNACLTDRDMAVAMMEVYRQGMEEFGIRGTPSFVINGETYSNMSFAEFQSILDPLLRG